MENVYDQLGLALGHKSLFSRKVPTEEIVEIISQYSVSEWLDFFAKIEGFLLVQRPNIPEPQVYLANSIFPKSTLNRIKNHAKKGDMYFAPGQLNLARKLAISYGQIDISLDRPGLFASLPSAAISKVLLGIHDLHNQYDEEVVAVEGTVAEKLENFCQFIIRNGFLNGHLDSTNLFIRARQIYIIQGQTVPFPPYSNFASYFREIVGITVEQAMSLAFALANPLFQNEPKLAVEPTIINPNTFFQNLLIDPAVTNSIVESLTIDLVEARKKILQELNVQDIGTIPAGYNLDTFRKTPLIRLVDGRLAHASLAYLLQKTTQNIIWLPKNRMPNLTKEQSDKLVIAITDHRGQLFQEYIKSLCKIMAEKNSRISYYYIPPQKTRDHEEVGDTILLQDNKLILLEAKSRQFNEGFKYTGEWTKDKLFIEELIKKAAQQISVAANKILAGEVNELPITPRSIQKIFPVVVTYEPIPMHGKMQRFIRDKVREFRYLTDDIFAPLEIVDVNDLEQFMDAADGHTFIEVLEQKHKDGEHAAETNFNNYFSFYTKNKQVISNGWQRGQFDDFWKNIVKPSLPFKDGAIVKITK